MKPLLIALQFLTILPIRISEIKEKDLGRSLLYFPLVGTLIGLMLASLLVLLFFLPDLLRAVLILVISIFITGGIHLDGFADTCDGFYAGRSKEEILQIMRDSRIGVMGAVGITCLLLLKFTLIVGIPKDLLWKSLIIMAVFSRWSQGLACYSSKYARENGKAKFFIEYATLKEVILGGLFSIAIFWLLVGLEGLILFCLNFTLVFLFISYIKKRVGGMTGDTIGATNEIAEVIALFSILIYPKIPCF